MADAALEIIAQRGISTLSTTTLARAVGLTPGALFRHFDSVDAILALAVERAVEELARTYPPSDLPPVERIERFVEARMALATRKLGIPRLVLSDQFARALPPSSRDALRRAIAESASFVSTAVRDGQRDGSIRGDLDAGALALIVLGGVQMAILQATIFPGVASPIELSPTVRTLLTPPRSKGAQ